MSDIFYSCFVLLALMWPHAATDESGPGWGKEREGIRARMTLDGGRNTIARQGINRQYALGDFMGVKLILKNVTSARKSLRLKSLGDWMVNISHQTLTVEPDQKDPQTIDLLPGEEHTFQGPQFHFCNSAALAGPPDIPIVPGRYKVRCPLPFWIPVDADPNSSTGFNAVPGTVDIEILPGPQHQLREVGRIASRAQSFLLPSGISWGEPANGLVAGLRPLDVKRGNAAVKELRSEIIVRNVSETALSFSFSELQEYDWNPIVTNQRGEGARVETIFVGGLRYRKSVTLKPGEWISIGKPVLDVNPPEAASQFHRPRIMAAAGSYSEYYTVSIKPEGPPTSRVHVTVVTGKLPFEVN